MLRVTSVWPDLRAVPRCGGNNGDLSTCPQGAGHSAGRTEHLEKHCGQVRVWVLNKHTRRVSLLRGTEVLLETPWRPFGCFQSSVLSHPSVIRLGARSKPKDFWLFSKIKHNLCGVSALNLEWQWLSRFISFTKQKLPGSLWTL